MVWNWPNHTKSSYPDLSNVLLCKIFNPILLLLIIILLLIQRKIHMPAAVGQETLPRGKGFSQLAWLPSNFGKPVRRNTSASSNLALTMIVPASKRRRANFADFATPTYRQNESLEGNYLDRTKRSIDRRRAMFTPEFRTGLAPWSEVWVVGRNAPARPLSTLA